MFFKKCIREIIHLLLLQVLPLYKRNYYSISLGPGIYTGSKYYKRNYNCISLGPAVRDLHGIEILQEKLEFYLPWSGGQVFFLVSRCGLAVRR